MAEHVVDALEAVQIDQMQRELPVAAPRPRHQRPHPLAEQDPVGQVGQLVVMGEMAQMRLHLLAL